MEAEKRMRREIANSNERRRMQSINAGFQSLRTLLPRHEGEKLSKAAILQQTAEYIYCLEQEKTRLLSQNSHLKRLINQHDIAAVSNFDPPPKKKKLDPVEEALADVVDETTLSAVAVAALVPQVPDEADELRAQLDRERRFRLSLEERVRAFETQQYRDVAVRLRYDSADELDRVVEDDEGDLLSMIPDADELRQEVVDCGRSPSPPRRTPADDDVRLDGDPETLPPSPGDASRPFATNTSRQNLETIVEAIRHLEGDHLFAEERPRRVEQDVPLALTNKDIGRRTEPDGFARFRPQHRPGVIVVKPS